MQDLTRAALDPDLTTEQIDALARQKTDNMIRLAEEQRRLEDDGQVLFGLERVFSQEIDELIEDGRFAAPTDLIQMIERFLERPDLSGRLIPDANDPRLHRMRLTRNGRTTISEALRSVEIRDRSSISFQRWLEGDDPNLAITFDQDLALERRDLQFITPVHQLTRLAASYWATLDTPLIARLALQTDLLPSGAYLFTCDLWETIALRPEIQLTSYVWDLQRSEPNDELASRLLLALSNPELNDSAAIVSTSQITVGLGKLDELAHQRRLEALEQLRERNEVLVARRLASLNSYFTNRIERIQRDLATAQDPRILRMRKSEQSRVEREFSSRQRAIDDRRESDILSKRIATGILSIEGF